MRRRTVGFSPEAEADLVAIYEWIAEGASGQVASSFIERIENYCRGFDLAAERGRAVEGRVGLRAVGFRRQATILFRVGRDRVTIMRIYAAGKNWTDELDHAD